MTLKISILQFAWLNYKTWQRNYLYLPFTVMSPYTVCIIWFFKLNLPCQWRMTSRISLNCWNLHSLTLLRSDLKPLWISCLAHPVFTHYSLTSLHLLAICKQPLSCHFYGGEGSYASLMLLLISLWICTILFRHNCLLLYWALIFLLLGRKA